MSIGGSEIGQTAKNLFGKVFEGSDGVLRELWEKQGCRKPWRPILPYLNVITCTFCVY